MMERLETKVFDPADGFGSLSDVVEVTDPTLARRENQWWLYCASEVAGRPGIQLVSASLPAGAPLSPTGWTLTPDPDDARKIATLAGYGASHTWDLQGGRHCPCYVRGWDPERGDWVERIYYAGSAEHLWGPYAIGFLEWNGHAWIDQPAPAFVAIEPWERGSVYEPNVIYADGMWKLWYVAGSNQQDYLVHGFAESPNGRTGWSARRIFAPAEERMFDFCVFPGSSGYEAVFSRVWVRDAPAPPETGLWWCTAPDPSGSLEDWSRPVHIMTAEDRGWHAGPWKPSARQSDRDLGRRLVFFSGSYSRNDGSPFPFVFTLGCVEIDRPSPPST
jgi:hypothetical protein